MPGTHRSFRGDFKRITGIISIIDMIFITHIIPVIFIISIIFIIQMIFIMNNAYIIPIIIIMIMTYMISAIIIIFTRCIKPVITIQKTPALPSTSRAVILRSTSPWSAWPSHNRRRVEERECPTLCVYGKVCSCRTCRTTTLALWEYALGEFSTSVVGAC